MILAITQRYRKISQTGHFTEFFIINKYFKDIFEELNVILFPIASLTQLEEATKICDGLIITGRTIDINPKYYGEKFVNNTNLSNYYNAEDELDFNLIKSFHIANKPILGVCAGIQSINVYFGGSLHQDIKNHCSDEERNIHLIEIQKESFLKKCYKADEIEVNSFHHQAINKVAENFKVTAISKDGIIEAIEYNNIIGVQWHPEEMRDIEFFKKYIEEYF